ncbi:ADP-ribosylation factor-like protein 13B isoform X2 [Sarcophilus harrisii]|uniref:ADP ribosylation factor like GTPase 13B n=1 Tax=Sarcophilus harrisii TaxID=9305 RepID=G3VCP7_SARHA|nr:ADP-ribosylation factor-like protein 13B isoform X2 [Sarcophilus harrisii]
MAGISRCKLFSFLTACFPCKKNYQVPLRKVTLLMLGLENAGKTDTARVLKGESSIDVTTTIGFSRINFIRGNFDVTIFDIGGGGKGIRTLWKYYYAESYGLIFVIDSSDVNRLEESKEAINEILKHPTMSGKPVLVLADKQDKEGALSETCLVKCLSLDTLINEQKCLCQLKGCSTLLFTGKKIDKSIKRGIFWLLSCIGNDFYTLKSRVERDTKAQQIFEEMKKRERAERVRQLRREREEREKEYATEHPEFLRCDSDIDLFKPTDIVLRENERRKQRMDKDIDRIFLRTHIEQKKPDIQNQFSNASERKFDDSICTEPYSVLSYIPPTEKEIDSVQQLSDCEDSDFNEKKNDTFGVIACNQIVPHNISNPDLETQEMPGPSHPIHGFHRIQK